MSTQERLVKQRVACSCREHESEAPTTVRGVSFGLFANHEHAFMPWWRWRCSCGSAGQWQCQSQAVSYHQWLKHVERRHS